jgi:hypothetical protein
MILHPLLHLQSDDQFCTSCRKKVGALPIQEETEKLTSSSQDSQDSQNVCQPGPSGANASVSEISDETFESPDQ